VMARAALQSMWPNAIDSRILARMEFKRKTAHLDGPDIVTVEHRRRGLGLTALNLMRRAFVRLLGISPGRYRELAEHSSGA
jgi:AraC-like DNA-binding protein